MQKQTCVESTKTFLIAKFWGVFLSQFDKIQMHPNVMTFYSGCSLNKNQKHTLLRTFELARHTHYLKLNSYPRPKKGFPCLLKGILRVINVCDPHVFRSLQTIL